MYHVYQKDLYHLILFMFFSLFPLYFKRQCSTVLTTRKFPLTTSNLGHFGKICCKSFESYFVNLLGHRLRKDIGHSTKTWILALSPECTLRVTDIIFMIWWLSTVLWCIESQPTFKIWFQSVPTSSTSFFGFERCKQKWNLSGKVIVHLGISKSKPALMKTNTTSSTWYIISLLNWKS